MSIALEDRLHRLLGGYVAAPQWVKTLAGSAYRRLPVAWRRGAAYGRFAGVLQHRNPEWLTEYGRQQLLQTVRWAVDTVPAYRALRAQVHAQPDPVRALALFPLTEKLDIKASPERYVSTGLPQERRLRAFTGGSTAEPMAFFLERDVTRSREYAFMNDFHARVGCSEEDVVLALRGRSVPSAATPGGRLWMYEPIKRHLILSSDHLEERWMPQYEQTLDQWRPAFIQAFPSALYPLARWLREHPNPAWQARVRGVMLYSENVYDYQMRLFHQVFPCPVLRHYGHSERVLMAATLPGDDRYHFWPQYGWFELVDESGQAVTEPGILGEIVGTSFDNRVMPFVRYRTGDLAMLSPNPEAGECQGYPVVERIEGRLQEFVVCHDRRLVSICTLGAAHFEELACVEAIQYEQREPGRLILKVASNRTLAEDSMLRIGRAIKEKTQGGCVAEVLRVDSIARTARGKHVMLIQHLRLDDYLGHAGPAVEAAPVNVQR